MSNNTEMIPNHIYNLQITGKQNGYPDSTGEVLCETSEQQPIPRHSNRSELSSSPSADDVKQAGEEKSCEMDVSTSANTETSYRNGNGSRGMFSFVLVLLSLKCPNQVGL